MGEFSYRIDLDKFTMNVDKTRKPPSGAN